MQHTYSSAWPRIMKIGQIDVLFAVNRSKMKRRETYKDSVKDVKRIFVFFRERSKLISSSGHDR